MKSTNAIQLNEIITLKVNTFCENPKLANISLTLLSDSYGEEGVYYPAQSVTVYGPYAIKMLREVLESLPKE